MGSKRLAETLTVVLIRYLDETKLNETTESLGLLIKPKNTVVEQWPFRLRLRPGLVGSQE